MRSVLRGSMINFLGQGLNCKYHLQLTLMRERERKQFSIRVQHGGSIIEILSEIYIPWCSLYSLYDIHL